MEGRKERTGPRLHRTHHTILETRNAYISSDGWWWVLFFCLSLMLVVSSNASIPTTLFPQKAQKKKGKAREKGKEAKRGMSFVVLFSGHMTCPPGEGEERS